MTELNPSAPISKVTSGSALPATPSGVLFMGAGGGLAYPLPLNAAGTAVNTSSPVSGTNIPTVLKIEAALINDNIIIASPLGGVRIYIWHFNFLTRGIVNIRMFSNLTELSGLYNFGSGTGMAFDSTVSGGPLVCGVDEDFIMNFSAATAIDGFVLYSTF